VLEIPLDHPLIEISQLPVTACHLLQEIADQAEAPPCASPSEPVFDQPRRIQLDELSVLPTPQTPKQPAPAQVFVCSHHHPVLRC
jgi:hypothetical protein